MSIIIIDSFGRKLELNVRQDLADALYVRTKYLIETQACPDFGNLSALQLLKLIISLGESFPIPPTEAQIKFALDIKKKLKVEIPAGAFQDRMILGGFISKYEDMVRKRPSEK